jgi:hypothetical protein
MHHHGGDAHKLAVGKTFCGHYRKTKKDAPENPERLTAKHDTELPETSPPSSPGQRSRMGIKISG